MRKSVPGEIADNYANLAYRVYKNLPKIVNFIVYSAFYMLLTLAAAQLIIWLALGNTSVWLF